MKGDWVIDQVSLGSYETSTGVVYGYNYSYFTGFEEVDQILQEGALKAY